MADYDFAKIEKKLAKYLDEDRFQHTMGVMYTSACLAMVHGYDIKDAQVLVFFTTVPNVYREKRRSGCATNIISTCQR